MSNCEFETRVNNLITSLITLKEYANEIERSIHIKPSLSYVYDNINNIMGSNTNINQIEIKGDDDIYNLKMINSLKEVSHICINNCFKNR